MTFQDTSRLVRQPDGSFVSVSTLPWPARWGMLAIVVAVVCALMLVVLPIAVLLGQRPWKR